MSPEYYFLILLGISTIVIAAVRPELFWRVLIVSSLFTCGLMIKGHCFIDELVISCLILGLLLAGINPFKPVISSSSTSLEKTHGLVFFSMILYLIIQSFRGMIVHHDLLVTRWILYYGMILLLFLFLRSNNLIKPSSEQAYLLIATSAASYFAIYLIYGVYCETVMGTSRYTFQGIDWSGSSYSVFPVFLAIPAAFYLFNNNKKALRFLGWLLIVLIVVTGFYYDSRVIFLSFLGFTLLASLIKLKKALMLILIYIIIFSALYHVISFSDFLIKFKKHILGVGSETITLVQTRPSDLDRKSHLLAAIETVSFKPMEKPGPGRNFQIKTLLFGYGINSHRWALRPYLQKRYDVSMPGLQVPYPVRSTGFSAILVDTGLTGLLLILANFIFCAIYVWKKTVKKLLVYRYVFLFSLLVAFLWLFISNIIDYSLFFIIIMPYSLLSILLNKNISDDGS
jgi:hypothetical protein